MMRGRQQRRKEAQLGYVSKGCDMRRLTAGVAVLVGPALTASVSIIAGFAISGELHLHIEQ